jgi:hypothetical protein
VAEKKFLVDLNLSGNKAKNFRLEDYADNTSPTSNFVGRMIYTTNSTNPDRIEVYNGSAWKALAYTDDVPAVSLSLTAPDLFTVSGSPAAYNGTLDFEWNVVNVNTVLAGPSTGSTAAIPTFRSLVAADIPSLESTKISDFSEAVADTIGAMVTSNTENGISVTYDDSDNTLDFDVADFSITLTGDVTGSGTVTNLANVSFEATVGNDTHNHTTSTLTGIQEFVEDTASTMITAATHSGISVAYTDNSTGAGTLAFTNTGVLSVAGTTNEISITEGTGTGPYTGAVKIGLPTNVVVAGDLKVNGDLDIVGNINSFSTTTVNVEDNLFLLNSTVTGTPSVNAGIEVERGTSTNASLIWNETSDKWTAGIAGSEIAIARKYVTTTTGTTHTITHGLATSDVTVNCWLAGAQVEAEIVITDTNTVTVTTNESITDLKTVVVG